MHHPDSSPRRFWIGGYTADMGGNAQGIMEVTRGADGRLGEPRLVATSASPSYLVRSGRMLLAANEGTARVSAFAVEDGALRPVSEVSAAGGSPCALTVSPGLLFTASYGDGAVGVHELDASGVPGAVAQRLHSAAETAASSPRVTAGPHPAQDGPHAHDVLVVPSGTDLPAVVLTADLGADRVFVHDLIDGRLIQRAEVSLPPGTGPRDLLLHPSGYVLMLGELSNRLHVLDGPSYRDAGSVALPGAQPHDQAAGLQFSADHRFVYTGLRGSNRIAVVAVSEDGATLEPVASVSCGGEWPRHLVVENGWLHVANQLSNSIVTFELGDDGIPSQHSVADMPSPTYVLPD